MNVAMLKDAFHFVLASGRAEFVRYLFCAASMSALVLVWRHFKIRSGVIRMKYPGVTQIAREFINSAKSIFVFQFSFIVIITLSSGLFANHAPVKFGWYYIASFVIIVLAHDTYFYWTHRLMHHKRLFRVFHYEHHRSLRPSAWAAYSFSVAEALVQGAFLPIFLILLPTPRAAIYFLLLLQISYNVVAHSGIDIFPRWLVNYGLVCGSTHHDMHHARARGNYGLYFRIWDRLMGTEYHDFEPVFEAVRAGHIEGARPAVPTG